jgi:translation initiation factor IF-2
VAKVRVHELAKELGVSSKEVLGKLSALGEYVKSASSTVEAPVVRKLRESFASQPAAGNKSAGKPDAPTSAKKAPSAPSAPTPAEAAPTPVAKPPAEPQTTGEPAPRAEQLQLQA